MSDDKQPGAGDGVLAHDYAREGGPPENWPPRDPGREALTREQAAKLIGVSAATLCNWGSFRHGPRYFRDGRKVFYRRRDVEEWIATRPAPRASW